MTDALSLFGYTLLLFIGSSWIVSWGIDWLIRRIKHD